MQVESPVVIKPVLADVQIAMDLAWSKISPHWPLKQLVAANPLMSYETQPFEQALNECNKQIDAGMIPSQMHLINLHTIKWCGAFFDQGQTVVQMPGKENGLFPAWKGLACWDSVLLKANPSARKWLSDLPDDLFDVINYVVEALSVPPDSLEDFFKFMLTSLNGWAGHIQYLSEWRDAAYSDTDASVKEHYLALRLCLTYLLWPDAVKFYLENELMHQRPRRVEHRIDRLVESESAYTDALLTSLSHNLSMPAVDNDTTPEVQAIFCIDVRSEMFRRAFESTGQYKTYGYAGFFGLPVSVKFDTTKHEQSLCPVLLKPSFKVGARLASKKHRKRFAVFRCVKQLFYNTKYSMTTPFALVETLGIFSAFWMSLRNFMPRASQWCQKAIKTWVTPEASERLDLEAIPIREQCQYALQALNMIGLRDNFAPIVLICGHESTTSNNAFAAALQCGACGGQSGQISARLLADIFNKASVRAYLYQEGIDIPAETVFIAGTHDTCTDEVKLSNIPNAAQGLTDSLNQLRTALALAQKKACSERAKTFGFEDPVRASTLLARRSADWAQVRPEWGLANNASFIIGPRSLTENVNLNGRAFLHSYDWQLDTRGEILLSIMTAPVVVAHWINMQYLFSTLNNSAYGAGSKVTNNIIGKMGVMQGNASDLMHGLPLESVFTEAGKAYHTPQRLVVVIYAPLDRIMQIIKAEASIAERLRNGWLNLVCLDPTTKVALSLTRSLQWSFERAYI